MSLSSDVNALASAIGVKIKAVVADVANKQPINANLTSIATLTAAANKMLYATGANTWALADLSAYARTVLDDVSASAMRATIDVYSKAESAALVVPVALMGSAKITSGTTNYSGNTTLGGTGGYISGLACTVTGDGRPVVVNVHIPSLQNSQTSVFVYLNQGSVMKALAMVKSPGNTVPGLTVSMTYLTDALTTGVSYTFSVGVRTNPASAGSIYSDPTYPSQIMVTRA